MGSYNYYHMKGCVLPWDAKSVIAKLGRTDTCSPETHMHHHLHVTFDEMVAWTMGPTFSGKPSNCTVFGGFMSFTNKVSEQAC